MPYIKIHFAGLMHTAAPHSNHRKEDGTYASEEASMIERTSVSQEKKNIVDDTFANTKHDQISLHDVEHTSVNGSNNMLQLLKAIYKKMALDESETSIASSNATVNIPCATHCSEKPVPQTTQTQLTAGQPSEQNATNGIFPVKKTRKVRKITFAEKLMDILSTKDNEDFITWFPEGNSFTIVSKGQLERDILPKYFKEAKFQSFVRKLYRWGFRRISDSPKDTIFYHPMFLRDRPELCSRMRSCNIIVEDSDVSRSSVLKQKEIEARKSSARLRMDFVDVVNRNTKSSSVLTAQERTTVQFPEYAAETGESDSTSRKMSPLLNSAPMPCFPRSHLMANHSGFGNGLNLDLKAMLTEPKQEDTSHFFLSSGHGPLSNMFSINNKSDFSKNPVMRLEVGPSNLNSHLTKKLEEIYRRYKN